MHYFRLLAVAPVALAALQAQAHSPAGRLPIPGAPAGLTAFVDVAVVPMDTERVLPHQTVLIQGGRIAALGSVGEIKVPGRAVLIDGRNKYLMPGLSDCHAHIGANLGSMWRADMPLPPDSVYLPRDTVAERRLFRWLAEGVTTIRNLDWFDRDGAPPFSRRAGNTMFLNGTEALRLRARAAAGEIDSPRIYTSGQWGPHSYLETAGMFPDSVRARWSPLRLDGIGAYIAAYKAAGYDFVKTHDEAPMIFDSVLAAARRVGIPVVGHVSGPLERALAGGMQTVDHMVIPWRAGVWSCATLQLMGSGSEDARLRAAGPGLLLGSDFPLGAGVHRELEVLVQAGLTPYEALAAGTKNFGTYLRTLDPRGDPTGTIAAGHRADLVLLSGNPLADVHHAKTPEGVMVGGRWLPRVELDRRLARWSQEERSWRHIKAMTDVFDAFAERLGRAPQHAHALAALDSAYQLQRRALLDSLQGSASTMAGQQRLIALLARQLGQTRAALPAEAQADFDKLAQEWLDARKVDGYHAVISGVKE